jgi:hypothetical protein
MRDRSARSYRGLVLALLLCILGLALFTAHAAPLASAGLCEQAGAAQACYTLDTSRPEWLQTSPFVYLPVVLKNDIP